MEAEGKVCTCLCSHFGRCQRHRRRDSCCRHVSALGAAPGCTWTLKCEAGLLKAHAAVSRVSGLVSSLTWVPVKSMGGSCDHAELMNSVMLVS